jgi:hypothetical protein
VIVPSVQPTPATQELFDSIAELRELLATAETLIEKLKLTYAINKLTAEIWRIERNKCINK